MDNNKRASELQTGGSAQKRFKSGAQFRIPNLCVLARSFQAPYHNIGVSRIEAWSSAADSSAAGNAECTSKACSATCSPRHRLIIRSSTLFLPPLFFLCTPCSLHLWQLISHLPPQPGGAHCSASHAPGADSSIPAAPRASHPTNTTHWRTHTYARCGPFIRLYPYNKMQGLHGMRRCCQKAK